VVRRDDGTYGVGLEISDRYRELVDAVRAPQSIAHRLRRAALDSGYSHYLGRFINGRVALTFVAEGPRSPYLEDLMLGFDDGAHATALGKAMLSTLRPDERSRYLKETGMRQFTRATVKSPEALEAELVQGDRQGVYIELGQYRPDVGCVGVTLLADREPERRMVLAISAPMAEMTKASGLFRARLSEMSREIAVLALAENPPRTRPEPAVG